MKIDFNQLVTIIGGQQVRIGDAKGDPDTLGEICVWCLGAAITTERTDAVESYNRYKLGKLLEKGGEIDLNAGQIVLLRKCAGISLTPFVFGAVADLIDPPAEQ